MTMSVTLSSTLTLKLRPNNIFETEPISEMDCPSKRSESELRSWCRIDAKIPKKIRNRNRFKIGIRETIRFPNNEAGSRYRIGRRDEVRELVLKTEMEFNAADWWKNKIKIEMQKRVRNRFGQLNQFERRTLLGFRWLLKIMILIYIIIESKDIKSCSHFTLYPYNINRQISIFHQTNETSNFELNDINTEDGPNLLNCPIKTPISGVCTIFIAVPRSSS